MRFRLRSYEESPPGGYPYTQRRGIKRNFPSVPVIEEQPRIVADFRAGNGIPRATIAEALEDIDAWTCWRLGNMRQYCVPVDDEARASVALGVSSAIVQPCAGCGAVLTV